MQNLQQEDKNLKLYEGFSQYIGYGIMCGALLVFATKPWILMQRERKRQKDINHNLQAQMSRYGSKETLDGIIRSEVLRNTLATEIDERIDVSNLSPTYASIYGRKNTPIYRDAPITGIAKYDLEQLEQKAETQPLEAYLSIRDIYGVLPWSRARIKALKQKIQRKLEPQIRIEVAENIANISITDELSLATLSQTYQRAYR